MGYGLWSCKESETTEATEHACMYLALRDSPQTLSSTEEEVQSECKVLLDSQGVKRR